MVSGGGLEFPGPSPPIGPTVLSPGPGGGVTLTYTPQALVSIATQTNKQTPRAEHCDVTRASRAWRAGVPSGAVCSSTDPSVTLMVFADE